MNKTDALLGIDPLLKTLGTIGDSYAFLVVREAFFGARRFEDFAASLHIPRARLAERLKHLVALGVFEKRPYSSTKKRFEYRFTPKGLSLYQIALTLLEWGDEWRPRANSLTLFHSSCGRKLVQKTVCSHCKHEVTHKDIVWPISPSLREAGPQESTVNKWRKTGRLADVSERVDSAAETLDAIGDRWSMLIMYLALHGPFRFKDARNSLGVADNILSNRLKHLIQQGLLERHGQSGRQSYHATKSGIALLPTVLAQRMWAIEWESHPDIQWTELRHSACGKALRTKCICATCEQTISPDKVDVH